MKRWIAPVALSFAGLAMALLVFGSGPLRSEPERSEIVGEWECADLPRGFIAQLDKTGSGISKISIRDDGSLSASNFPQRSPYRLIDIDGAWSLSDPSITPSGAWSVEFQRKHLQVRRQLGRLVLRYSISGKDNYYADYVKR
ncbi:MAG: hypothetical protein AAGB14_12865 [Verrucomicrobiota bacterium]